MKVNLEDVVHDPTHKDYARINELRGLVAVEAAYRIMVLLKKLEYPPIWWESLLIHMAQGISEWDEAKLSKKRIEFLVEATTMAQREEALGLDRIHLIDR